MPAHHSAVSLLAALLAAPLVARAGQAGAGEVSQGASARDDVAGDEGDQEDESAHPVPIWPMPASHSRGKGRIFLIPSSQFQLSVLASEPADSLIRKAYFRALPRIFLHGEGEAVERLGAVPGINISVDEGDTDLQLDVDESYLLNINEGQEIYIRAPTVFGAYHALETLSQLVDFDFATNKYSINRAPWKIEDSPRFPHRGLLVDSARHFEPVWAITSILDSMAMAKLNVLHWHITDSQSFPAASRAFPELAAQGAFSSDERYTMSEMKHIVEYARARGIRVVPEIDMPGHSASWRKAHPDLFPPDCNAKDFALDPANEGVYQMVEKLVKDWADIFTDKVFHIGTDEVPEECWNNTNDRVFMQNHAMGSTNELFSYFVARIAEVVRRTGKTATVWDESLSAKKSPPGDVIVQVWRSWVPNLVDIAVQMGHQVIVSPDPWWYLDHVKEKFNDMYTMGGHRNFLTPRQPDIGSGRVIGGEGCMWGEQVDASVLELSVWPRMAAVAEQLWSPEAETRGDYSKDSKVTKRLSKFRCLLVRRGVRAGRTEGHARDAPFGPGSCSEDVNNLNFLQEAEVTNSGRMVHRKMTSPMFKGVSLSLIRKHTRAARSRQNSTQHDWPVKDRHKAVCVPHRLGDGRQRCSDGLQ